jgi:hypothetical protein
MIQLLFLLLLEIFLILLIYAHFGLIPLADVVEL